MTAPGRLRLDQTAAVVLVGGNGTVSIGPDGSHEYWYPDTVSVIAPNPAGGVPANEATCNLYAGPRASQEYFVDGTYSGSSGDSSGRFSGFTIGRHANAKIWAVWSGGDPGATATLRVQGTKEIR